MAIQGEFEIRPGKVKMNCIRRTLFLLTTMVSCQVFSLTNTTIIPGVFHQTSAGHWSRVAVMFRIESKVSEGTIFEEGEAWFNDITEDGLSVAPIALRYINGCLEARIGSGNWMILECINQTDPAAPNYKPSITLLLTPSKRARCFLENSEYVATLVHSGNTVIFDTFAPTPQLAGEIDIRTSQPSISPVLDEPLSLRELLDGGVLPVIAAGTSEYSVRVSDRWNCRHPVKDSEVFVDAKIRVNSNESHLHFITGERGTGEISTTNSAHTVGPDGTTISGGTNTDGEVTFSYTAGKYGITERLTALTFSPAFNQDIGRFITQKIAIGGRLSPIDTTNGVLLRGGFGDACGDNGHNTGDGNPPSERRSAYVTGNVRNQIRSLARIIHE